VRVNLDANLRFIFRGTGGERLGTLEQTISGRGTATGLGDIVVRGKYNVLKQPGGGVAIGVDVRLPSGKEEDLLGLPATQAKVYGIFSTVVNVVSPHVNVGYTFSRSNDKARDPTSVFIEPPQEINYAGGVDVAIRPRLTVVGDVVGRTLRDTYRLATTD